MTAELIVILVAIIAPCFGLVCPKRTLYAAIFFAPWQGLDPDIGLRITVFRIILAALFAISLVGLCTRKLPLRRIAPMAGPLKFTYSMRLPCRGLGFSSFRN